MRILIILLAIVVLLLIVRFFYRQSPANRIQMGRWLLLTGIAVLFLFLLLTHRLPWFFAAIAAAVTLLFRLLPLLRYVPMLRSVYKRYQSRQFGSSGAATGQASTVQSRFLRMVLQHDSGEIGGEVLEGQFKGRQLQQLTLPQLLALLHECQQDKDSWSLLTTYLDRVHPNWAAHANGEQSTRHSEQSDDMSASKMSVQEAYQILGLSEGASREQVIQAHRRLMQKLHPDHGGSDYLAAKINLAKQILLKPD